MGVYLFIQVRATPAEAQAVATRTPSSRPPAASTDSPPTVAVAADKKQVVASAEPTPPVPGSTRTLWDGPKIERTAEGDDTKVNLKVDSMMELANKAYDSQDFDQAIAIAGKVLTKEPNNVRMLRIMVSANCIQGDNALAQQHYEKLPKFDREQMKSRCDRYGVVFKEPPP